MDKGPSEIAKLTERISKDPKSKLFVPLAEEYKKTGDIDMSIQVLQDGLKNNPAYVTARSILGRLLIEKGDLSGARKEFEEVVKAIPDNLIAHKKLGDIYALQEKPADALGQYKTVLMLNPKDAETVMLVSEIEAGRDIKKHLAKPAASGEPQKSQEQRISPAPAAKLQAAPLSKPPEAVRAAAPAVEEPEEVLVVEPLDSPETGSLEQQLAASNMGFLAETPDEAVEARAGEKTDLFADGDPFAAGETHPVQRAGVLEKPEEGPFEFAAEPEKQADDFTTDTLAELYISQGFYEKAIDIYERMLVDKPNSQGLKDKLEKVREMAAAASSQETEEVTAFNIPAGLDSDPISGDAHAGEQDSGLGAFVLPDDQPATAPLDQWEPAASDSIPVIEENVRHPVQQRSEPKQFDVGFEPREYVPPDAVHRKKEETADEVKGSAGVNRAAEQRTAAARKSPASKKETIERLEGWLKNIMKEN